MNIGIDISQVVYEGTGVARYVRMMVLTLVEHHPEHKYILFGASLRRMSVLKSFVREVQERNRTVIARFYRIPPYCLSFLWNTLHIIPIEWFLGNIDVFWSSDWTQPPLRDAIGVTTVHDLTFLRYPESHVERISKTQQMRLKRAVNECDAFFCDSHATKVDFLREFAVEEEKVHVVYPGFGI